MNGLNNISSRMSQAGIYTDLNSLAELRAETTHATGAKKTQATRQVAQQLESLFLQMMLKSMRSASPATESGETDQTRFYQGMFDKQIALDLANRPDGSIGLAAILEKQLGAGTTVQTKTDTALKPLNLHLPATTKHNAIQPPQSVQSNKKFNAQTPEQFIQSLWSHASRAAEKIGVKPEVLIAQSALETGWGQKMMAHVSGNSANNLFGVKADSRWQDDRVSVPTVEYRDGIAAKEQAAFRAYASIQDSFDDYTKFLKNSPRYQSAMEHAGNSTVFLEKLQQAGYSTDPVYAKKIQAITQRGIFVKTVMALKNNQQSESVNVGTGRGAVINGGNK